MIFASYLPCTFPAVAPHPLEGLPGNQKRPARVGREHRIPLPDGQLLKLCGLVIGCVVDQNVDAPQFAAGFFHHGADTGFVRHITPQGERANPEATQIDDCLSRLACRISEGDGHISSCFSESQRRRPAQAPCRSRDKRRFPTKRLFFVRLHAWILPPHYSHLAGRDAITILWVLVPFASGNQPFLALKSFRHARSS